MTIQNNTNQRYTLIDALRGVASLAVVLFHAKEGGHITEFLVALPAFNQWLSYCESGVPIFFVISGFVITNSIWNDNVTGRYVMRFLLRRSLRLDPPYWAAILLALLFSYMSSRYVSDKIFVFPTTLNIFLHLTYLVDLARQPLINMVYWTLCIEIQFYLSFVLLMWIITYLSQYINQILARYIILLSCTFIASLWMTPFAPFHVQGLFLERWYLFITGVWVWIAINTPTVLASLIAIGNIIVIAILLKLFSGIFTDYIGLAIALIILAGGHLGFLKTFSGGQLLKWLGLISYSLYLTHNTVSGAVFNIGYRFVNRTPFNELVLLSLVVLCCCIFAWLFFLVFEKSGMRWSKNVLP